MRVWGGTAPPLLWLVATRPQYCRFNPCAPGRQVGAKLTQGDAPASSTGPLRPTAGEVSHATNRSRRAALHSSCPEVSTVTRETPGNADGDVFPGLELRFQRHFPDLSVTARARSFHATLTGLSVCRAGACRDARQSRIHWASWDAVYARDAATQTVCGRGAFALAGTYLRGEPCAGETRETCECQPRTHSPSIPIKSAFPLNPDLATL